MSKEKNLIRPDYLYRKGVGAVIINNHNEIFVGKRIDNNSDAWQMPQGGIDNNENEDLAVFREINEETSISPDKLEIISKSNNYFYYNLPYNLQKKFWGGKYLGQKQRWYLLKFTGQNQDINVATDDPEFSDWKWVSRDNIIDSIVEFKREMYQQIFNEFSIYL